MNQRKRLKRIQRPRPAHVIQHSSSFPVHTPIDQQPIEDLFVQHPGDSVATRPLLQATQFMVNPHQLFRLLLDELTFVGAVH